MTFVRCEWILWNRVFTAYQDVVRLDVGVEYVASFQQLEGQEELLTVGTHSLDVEPDVFTVFLQDLPQIHATRKQPAIT